MKVATIALFLAVMLSMPVAAHERVIDMLKDAAVNHDLEKVNRQFEALVKKSDASAQAGLDRRF